MLVLLDTDVVLDYVLQREDFLSEANEIFAFHAKNVFKGYITANTPLNVYYFARKKFDAEKARQTISDLLATFDICLVDSVALKSAVISTITDFEDAVQHACAEAANLDAIVTRNLSEYKNASIPVYSPAEFLNLIKTS
ncbi:MAG TPA: PIN domain-containing protein [Pyrinomonadaceae bacterium]|jgi:predicted nucleic acid-binding protein